MKRRKSCWKRLQALALTLLLAVGAAIPVCAAETGDTVTAEPGKQVKYTVRLNSPASMAGFIITLEYDTSVFSLVADEDGEYVPEQGSFSNKGTLLANRAENGCNVIWWHTNNVNATGTLFTVTFDVSKDAKPGDYPIKVGYSAKDTVDIAGNLVALDLASGTITIPDNSTPTPPPAPPQGDEAVITVGSGKALVGETVKIPVSITNNPGFAGFSFQISGADGLELTGLEKGEVLKASEGSFDYQLSNGKTIWTASENVNGDGILFYMTFQVSESCPARDYDISVSLIDNEEENFITEGKQVIPVSFTSGALTVQAYRPGDVDDDGAITSSDLVAVACHMIGKTPLTGKALLAADVDGNGKITSVDCVTLARYLAGLEKLE